MFLKFVSFLLILNNLLNASVDCVAVDVKTTSGTVRGQTIQVFNQTIDEFLGIPFAEPPVGALRFAKPKPIEKPSTTIIDGTKLKDSCWQAAKTGFTYSENCLYVNVWSQSRAQNETKLKPVMFWIYGGSLIGGTIFDMVYHNGSILATKDVVFVSTNYRLGSFGFLYGNDSTAPGNVGFYDQNLAIQWVHDNIHEFGGDKDQITIFGESAGSWSVSAQLLSPLSKGLFKRAILESGAALYMNTFPHSLEESLNTSKTVAKRLNCTDDKQWLECLRKVNASALNGVRINYVTEGSEFLPYHGADALTQGHFNKDLDIIAGVVKTEGSLAGAVAANVTKDDFVKFVTTVPTLPAHLPDKVVQEMVDYYLKDVNLSDHSVIREKIIDFYGDFRMKCPTYLFAKRYAEHSDKTNVFFYEWTHTNRNKDDKEGIPHGSDINFVFGTPLLHPTTTSKQDIEFTENVVKYWTDFVKYGKTNAVWPQMVDKTGKTKETTTKILHPTEDVKTNDLPQCETLWLKYF